LGEKEKDSSDEENPFRITPRDLPVDNLLSTGTREGTIQCSPCSMRDRVKSFLQIEENDTDFQTLVQKI
jgi:hypothetical protein